LYDPLRSCVSNGYIPKIPQQHTKQLQSPPLRRRQSIIQILFSYILCHKFITISIGIKIKIEIESALSYPRPAALNHF